MAQSVESPAYYLFHLESERKIAVKNCETVERSEKSLFKFLFLMGYHSTVVLFRTGAGRCDDSSAWNKFNRHTVFVVEHIPDIFVSLCLSRDNLAAVNYRTATNSENKINAFLTDKFCTFLNFGISRVRHDAPEIDNGFACIFKPTANFVIQSGSFQ